MSAPPIGDLLRKDGLVSEDMVNYALTIRRVSRERLSDILLRLCFVTDADVARVLAVHAGLPYEPLEVARPDADALTQIPLAIAQKAGLLPMRVEKGQLIVATDDPFRPEIPAQIARFCSYPVRFVVSPASRLRQQIVRAYYNASNPIEVEVEQLSAAILAGREFNAERLFDLLLSASVYLRASDMHVSATQAATLVSYRVDGVMQLSFALPPAAHARLISACKVRCGLDIGRSNQPQDGRMAFRFLDGNYDMRISTTPTTTGESLVVRILAGTGHVISLEEAGFSEPQLQALLRMTQLPSGMILLTGPTGSGKTTSLYGMLRRIDAMRRNVLTIEDPVEYVMPLVRQVEVNEKAGVTFASATRSFLRQDPDVFLIGEIRDEETAAMTVRAAQTGHLVFSSLHTNDALGAVVRLRDLGVRSEVLSTSLACLVSQRLLRRLCLQCRRPVEGKGGNTSPASPAKDNRPRYEHVGCPRCQGTGYAGRQAVAEVMVIDEAMRRLIASDAPDHALRDAALEAGFVPMRASALSMVDAGLTDLAELQRVMA